MKFKKFLYTIKIYLIFFIISSFVTTGSVLLYISSLMKTLGYEFTEVEIRESSIITFINILIIALFFTFMYRVYRDKLIVGAESLESSDVLAFFRLMQNESEEIAQWKDTTIRKLTQTYRKLLNDAGLLAGDKMVPPLPSFALKRYLKAHDMNAYLMAIAGADE